ncbi:hypothetical protein NHQ30_007583 [Ciborinia camelliae]|nr:hypothetical protein NHQ30_007583 [Ciborinia camelliae]
MAARFSRIFDDWDQDYSDISMLEFGSNVNDSSPKYHSLHQSADLSERAEPVPKRSDINTFFVPFDDGISSRHLLGGGRSYASSFSPPLKDISQDSRFTEDLAPGEPRLRSGSGVTSSNLKRLWTKSTAFTKPRTANTFDGHFAQGKDGWWKKQMLVDRSLRAMAGFTFLCAIIMFIIMIVYLPAFYNRLNKQSTSVGGKDGESCKSMESKNTVSRIIIPWS